MSGTRYASALRRATPTRSVRRTTGPARARTPSWTCPQRCGSGESAVVELHPAAEREETVDPLAGDRLVRALPEVAPEHEGARHVVDAGHALDAGLARVEMLPGVVRIDRQAQCGGAVEVDRPREGYEVAQHGSRLSRIS